MKYQTMFDYFDATDFETKLTQSLLQQATPTQAIEDSKSTLSTVDSNAFTEESKNGEP